MTDSTSSPKTPWKNGYWANTSMPLFIYIIDGEKMDAKNYVALDYPDIGGGYASTIKFGDFGPARKEIAEATGDTNYNVEINFGGMYRSNGFVNEMGTEITIWGMTNAVERMKQLSPDEVKDRREDRDDFNAPRRASQMITFTAIC